MHEASKLRPVVIDESLVDLESLLLAREMGYTGRGAESVQGAKPIAADGGGGPEIRHVPVRARSDLSGGVADPLGGPGRACPRRGGDRVQCRQYVPAANRPWEARFPGIFRITDGTIETGCLTGPALARSQVEFGRAML